MAATFINPFYSQHVDLLWSSLLAEFGRTVNYWPGSDPSQGAPVDVIWPEGVEPEEMTPGRYSHALIRNASLASCACGSRAPRLGDVIENGGTIYDIVRVNAFAYNYSGLVLLERD